MTRRSRFEEPMQPPDPRAKEWRKKAWETRREPYGGLGHAPGAYGHDRAGSSPPLRPETGSRPGKAMHGGTRLGIDAVRALVALYLGQRLTRDFMLNRLHVSPAELDGICKAHAPKGSNEFL